MFGHLYSHRFQYIAINIELAMGRNRDTDRNRDIGLAIDTRS